MNNRYVWVLPVVALPLVFITTFLSLQQTPYANGWDGYYYLVQIKSYFSEGAMHSEDHSLVYPLLIAVQFLAGDYETAYKISAALIRTLFVISLFFFTSTVTAAKERDYGASNTAVVVFAAVSWAVISPTAIFFASQFPKNLLGFAFLFFLFGFSELSIQMYKKSGLNRAFIFLAITLLLLVGTFMTHRYPGVLPLLELSVSYCCGFFAV